ncbi:sulfur oxidation c-type cytochrome SoxA [Roseomonas sp. CECT 9278]|uniref:sulfur oxidation c-type cytochrome SoxA n=1 Tax=Roseomonas sp. CECT 9278 TaxID=2845823 RepID=UPI001E50FD03|nr:sulfur oxidation c-type cytochrome SoxA [Roseomonas sp. CECT 9278]CAH0245361.1 L-cysteine S-thiosulfotransferase subunit SoxA [Roseomonas sp. CECT 9278]
MIRRAAAAAALLACGVAAASELRPARDFLSPELRAQQDDPSRHPGWLWVEEGEALWQRGERSCQSCHGGIATMAGVATRYPAVAPDGALLNLEGRIERCRTQQQGAAAFGYESDALLSLTAAVAQRSRGLPMSVATDGAAAPFVEEGRRFYEARQGQLNLACGQCHDDNAGRRLRGDVISNGLGTGYPAYRLDWNTLGSLHRRLRACSLGVRATQLPLGAPEYLSLELFLAARAAGLPVEAPGLRR